MRKLLASSLLAAGLAEAGSGIPELTVFVYNYSDTPSSTVAAATKEAARIFRHAGLTTRWVDCPYGAYAICSKPRNRRLLEVRILENVTALPEAVLPASLGYSWQPRNGQTGVLANILVDRVQVLAARMELPLEILLGHVVAHELGHLLLGEGAHTSRGLMCAHWGKVEFTWATQGTLTFAPADAARMRSLIHRVPMDAAAAAPPIAAERSAWPATTQRPESPSTLWRSSFDQSRVSP